VANRTTLPPDPRLAAKIVDGEQTLAAQRANMGVMGWLFGNALEKPGNIAAFTILVSLLFIGAIFIWAPNDDPSFPRKEALTLFGGLVSGALGFVFGRGSHQPK
jgi:uncharacterized membrane protein YfcA